MRSVCLGQAPSPAENCAGRGHGRGHGRSPAGQGCASFKEADKASPPRPGAVLLCTQDAFCVPRPGRARENKEKVVVVGTERLGRVMLAEGQRSAEIPFPKTRSGPALAFGRQHKSRSTRKWQREVWRG